MRTHQMAGAALLENPRLALSQVTRRNSWLSAPVSVNDRVERDQGRRRLPIKHGRRGETDGAGNEGGQNATAKRVARVSRALSRRGIGRTEVPLVHERPNDNVCTPLPTLALPLFLPPPCVAPHATLWSDTAGQTYRRR